MDSLKLNNCIPFRSSAVMHVLFTALKFFLDGNDNPEDLEIPEKVPVETVIVAQAFVQYFAAQRKIVNKVYSKLFLKLNLIYKIKSSSIHGQNG